MIADAAVSGRSSHERLVSAGFAGDCTTIFSTLQIARKTFGHPDAKGDASEEVWLELLQTYLPERYQASIRHMSSTATAYSATRSMSWSSTGSIRRSSFTIRARRSFRPKASTRSSRRSKRSMPTRSTTRRRRSRACDAASHEPADPARWGNVPAQAPDPDPRWHLDVRERLVSLLWRSAMEGARRRQRRRRSARTSGASRRTAISFGSKDTGKYEFTKEGKPATAFLFKLISMLQFSGTVPMIDVNAYAEWLTE